VLKKTGSALMAVLGVLFIVGTGCFVVVAATGIGTSPSAFSAKLTGEAVAQNPYGTDPSGGPACPPLRFFGVRGSGEHSGYGSTIGALESSLHGLIPAMSDSPIDYPAIDVPIQQFIDIASPLSSGITRLRAATKLRAYHSSYQHSVTAGVGSLLAAYNAYQRKCPGYPVMFAGYSQGADVTVQAYDLLPRAKKSRVIMANFGDPHFNQLDNFIDQGSFNHALQAIMPHFWGEEPHFFPYFDRSHVHSWCLHGDTICNYSLANLIGCASKACPHYHYMDQYTSDAARWAHQAWTQLS
jgi:hypothetical protein